MPILIENIKIYEISEIAKKFKTKPKTIQDLVTKKRLIGQKIGNKFYVSENSLRIFFNSGNSNLDGWDNFHDEALKIKKEHDSGKRKSFSMATAFSNT